MAEHVVDLLETIEVDADDGEALVGGRGLRERRGEEIIEARPIGKIGERIVVGEMHDLVLGDLALGGVLRNDDDVLRVAGVVVNRHALRS